MDELQLVYWHWFVLAAGLGAVEILAPGIFFLWLAIASFATGVFALAVPESAEALQITVFGVLAIVLVVLAWKFFKKNPIASDQPLLNVRAAQYVGKSYTLETAIVNGTGRVRIADSTWKVEGPDAPLGALVKVTGFDGPVLKVEKIADPVAGTAAPKQETDHLAGALKDPLDRK